jgi:hypothetical protein
VSPLDHSKLFMVRNSADVVRRRPVASTKGFSSRVLFWLDSLKTLSFCPRKNVKSKEGGKRDFDVRFQVKSQGLIIETARANLFQAAYPIIKKPSRRMPPGRHLLCGS